MMGLTKTIQDIDRALLLVAHALGMSAARLCNGPSHNLARDRAGPARQQVSEDCSNGETLLEV